MSKRSNKRVIVLAAILAVVVAMFLMQRPAGVPSGEPDKEQQVAGALDGTPPGSVQGPARRTERRLGKGDVDTDEEAAEYLQQLFGSTIENKRTQIKAIEKLINYLMEMYPNDWQSRVQGLLAKTFPGLADQLFAQYQNMTNYNEWLKAHRAELAQLSYEDRRQALRDARSQYFGSDWEEIFETTLRNDHIFDAMAAINDAHDTSVDDKLSTYMNAINESYGEEAPQFLERRQTELLSNFLSLPAVQDDLYAMSPEERENKMTSIRATMGLDQDAQARWRQLDSDRDQSWDKGQQYMEKRDQIARAYSGDEQARRLDDLRQQTFGDEAEIVKSEEAGGFYRFDHRRVFGRE